MTAWQRAWRDGLAPQLPTLGLQALALALAHDDPALIQNGTTFPPPLQCLEEAPIEKACAVGLCGWKGLGLATVGQVEEYFARVCFQADYALGEPAGCRHFLNHYDETDRRAMRRELLAEVLRALSQRPQARAPDLATPEVA